MTHTYIYRPVCGTDGNTYRNKCLLELESCSEGGDKTLAVAHRGECYPGASERPPKPSTAPAIAAVSATAEGEGDKVEECFNSEACPFLYRYDDPNIAQQKKAYFPFTQRPVCGTDGETYSNICELRLTAKCLEILDLDVASRGECTKERHSAPAPCRLRLPSAGCPQDYSPVCGSDGVTYFTRCDLETKACDLKIEEGKKRRLRRPLQQMDDQGREEELLSVNHDGPCM